MSLRGGGQVPFVSSLTHRYLDGIERGVFNKQILDGIERGVFNTQILDGIERGVPTLLGPDPVLDSHCV